MTCTCSPVMIPPQPIQTLCPVAPLNLIRHVYVRRLALPVCDPVRVVSVLKIMVVELGAGVTVA